MLRIMIAIFFALHGIVHMLYLGQSARVFELQPGMVWPDGAWAFSGLLGNGATRSMANILLVIAALAFALGGGALLIKQPLWRPIIIGAAAFSSVIYLLLWDGGFQQLSNKGAVGILINVAILVAVLILQWPKFDI